MKNKDNTQTTIEDNKLKHVPLHAAAIFTISTIVYGLLPTGRLGSPEVELRYVLPDRDSAPPVNPAAT